MKALNEIINQTTDLTKNSVQYSDLQRDLKYSSETVGHLNDEDGYDCKICNNRGFNFFINDKDLYPALCTRDCECAPIRKSLRYLKKSGLKDVSEKYNLDKFVPVEEWQKDLKQSAEDFIQEPNGWFYIGGKPGCGKTHICSAISLEKMKKVKRMIYMLWVDCVKALKGTVMDFEKHLPLMDTYKNVDVLYIDDFF